MRRHSEATKLRLSRISRERWEDPEYRAKVERASAGKRIKLSESIRNSWKNPEVRSKRVKGLTGKKNSPETRRKISEGNKGKVVPAEVGAKISKAITGRVVGPETRRKISERHKGRACPEGSRVALDRLLHDPAHQARLRETVYDTGEDHHRAKWWHLKSPDGKTFRFRNVVEFVRANPELFVEGDRLKAGNRASRASTGLSSLSPGRKHPTGSWKGWTWVFSPELEQHLHDHNVKKK